jgi:hypothetical protein
MRISSFAKILTLVFAVFILASMSFGQTTFPGTGVGAIPDATACGPTPGTPLNITFNVTGVAGNVSNLSVDTTFGTPNHTWMGDIVATLIAPNATQFTVFGVTTGTTATAIGDSSDLGGAYTFNNAATGNWWDAAALAGAAVVVPPGAYRTAALGGAGATNAVTDMNAAFASAPANGTWTLRITDGCTGDTGAITAASLTIGAAPTAKAPVDFNGDGKTDWSVARNVGAGSSGATNQVRWFNSVNGGSGVTGTDWGIATDAFTPVDFDGDNKTDIAVWRPAAATVAAFYILQSATNTVRTVRFGQTGDDPSVVGDYDGDGKADPAVYRAGATGAQSTWFYLGSLANPSNNITFVPWGIGGDFPAPGDYDGDGKADVNVQRTVGANGQYILRRSSNAATTFTTFGLGTDFIVPGDYDGDGKTDIAVRRTISGVHNFFILQSSNAIVRTVQFGATGFNTATGDYDGDGKTDIAEWQPATGIFWVLQSTNGATASFQLGANGDFPVAAFNVH